MARAFYTPGWQQVSQRLSSPFFRRFLIFAMLCLLLYYVLHRQQQRFSELGLRSGIIPSGHPEH